MLDGGQQMVSQHAKENVGLGAVLQMMKNRPLHQRTLDVAEGILHPGEQNISASDFICGQILPIRFENTATVEFLSGGLFIDELAPGEVLVDRVIRELVTTRPRADSVLTVDRTIQPWFAIAWKNPWRWLSVEHQFCNLTAQQTNPPPAVPL